MSSSDTQFLIDLAPSVATVTSVSEGIKALLGFSMDDFVSGRVTLQSRIHRDDQDLATRLFTDTNTPSSGSFPLRLRQACGRIRIVRLTYNKIASSPLTGIQLILQLQDVMKLYQAEPPALMNANFRSMMDNTDDFIFFKNQDHVLTGASQTLASLCSFTPHWSDLIGQTDYEIFPETHADHYYRLEKQIYAGAQVANEIQTYQTAQGTLGWVDNRKYPIRNDDDAIVGLFGVARDVTARIKLEQELTQRAHTDYLTRLHNRGHFMSLAEQEFNRATRYENPLSVLMIDIDFFKQINDAYGHKAGDAVLIQLANVCRQTLREIDMVGRMGGEEFAVLMPQTGQNEASEVAERLRHNLAEASIAIGSGTQPLGITVSIGLATRTTAILHIEELINLADNALYQAKHAGRNQIKINQGK